MAGWEAELTDLVTRRGGALAGYAFVLSGDRAEAQDLVQDAVVKVFSRLRRPPDAGTYTLEPDGPVNVEGYVRQTILTLYLDGYRRRRRWLGLRHLLADDQDAPSAEGEGSARADVATALALLTPKQRACVVLRYFQDLTVPQIAEATGMAEGTVKRHLFDSMGTMRRALGTSPFDAAGGRDSR